MFGGKQDTEGYLEPPKSSSKPETVIGPSVRVDGQFRGDGDVVIEGEVKGSIKTKQNLTIGQGAKVKANIDGGSAQVAGQVTGNIKVKGELKIHASAQIQGDIEAKVIEIAAGAKLNGQVKMEVDGVVPTDEPIIEIPNIIKEKNSKRVGKTKKKAGK